MEEKKPEIDPNHKKIEDMLLSMKSKIGEINTLYEKLIGDLGEDIMEIDDKIKKMSSMLDDDEIIKAAEELDNSKSPEET